MKSGEKPEAPPARRPRKAKRAVDVLGVPTDYGANLPGVGMGPTAFRLASFSTRGPKRCGRGRPCR